MALFGSGRRLAAMNAGAANAPLEALALAPDAGVLADAPPRSLFGSAAGRVHAGQAIRQASAPMGNASISPPRGEAMQPSPLGGSMREGFDYEAAGRALAGQQKKPGVLPYILAGVSDVLANHYGNGGGNAVAMLNQMQLDQQARSDAAQAQLAKWRYGDFARQNEADLQASAPFTIGRRRVGFNPATGGSEVLYDGPQDFELYASELGLEPGTDAYFKAVEDYVLRSSGPSAHTRDLALDDYRTANDVRMEGLRFGNRQKLEGLRQGNRLEVMRNRPAPLGRGGGRAEAGQGGDGLPVVSSPAEAARLPKGTRFRTPDGRVKVVP